MVALTHISIIVDILIYLALTDTHNNYARK